MRRYVSSFGHARARALLTAAIAASVLLPFAGAAPMTASAASPWPAATVTARAESPDGLTRLALTPGESEARYIMTVKTLGQPPKPAACSTRSVTGEIVLAPDGSVVTELSKLVLDQRTLKCQAPLRDNMAQQLLQTDQHPLAEFLVTGTPGLTLPLPTGDASFQLAGDQSVRGVVRPTVYDTTASLTPDTMVGLARTTFKLTTFGMTPPSIGPLIQVADDVIAEVDLKATVGGQAIGGPAPVAASADETPE
jgi:hypothetical protein